MSHSAIFSCPLGAIDAQLRGEIFQLCSEHVYGDGQTYAPIWQTSEWQDMLVQTGYVRSSHCIGVMRDGRLVAYTCIEERSIGMGQHGLFVVGGPVCPDPVDLPLIESAIVEHTRTTRSLFVQIEPLIEMVWTQIVPWSYKRFIERTTALIDTTLSEDDILARMKPKGRYNIRLAERSGVTVSWVDPRPEHVDVFYRIFAETLERDSFAGNSLSYFTELLSSLHRTGQWGLALASREGRVIAGGVFTYVGATGIYYYGASVSSPEERRYMASYLLQWHGILEAKRRKCAVYDFLGIMSEDSRDDHLAGVTDFKLKLTDKTHRWPEARMYVARPLLYALFRMVRSMVRWVRR